MKRLIGLLMSLVLILTGLPAFAWGHDLDNEPVYDFSSGSLSGTIFWTVDASYKSGHPKYIESSKGERYHLYSMKLETGEIKSYDLDDSYYLVYSDLPGVAVAMETDGVLNLYQMDYDGNLTPILEIQLFTRHRFSGWRYSTAYAYYDGWLYYILSKKENDHPSIHLARVNESGDIFVYRETPYLESIALSPSGLLALIDHDDEEDKNAIIIQNPDDASILEVPMEGEYSEIAHWGYPVWYNDSTLGFCCAHTKKNSYSVLPDRTYSLHSYNLKTGEIKPAKNSVGKDAYLPYGIESPAHISPDGSMILLLEYMVSDLELLYGTPCIIDWRKGKEYKLAGRFFLNNDECHEYGCRDNRVVWYRE